MKNEINAWNKLYDEGPGNCLSPHRSQLHRKILDLIPDKINNILDAGCGGGELMYYLSKKIDCEIEGVDSSKIGVRNVVKNYSLKANVGDLKNLNMFEDKSFDLIICSEVTEHIQDDDLIKVLNEFMRISRKHIIITNPYKENLRFYQIECKNCYTKYHPAGHIQSVDEKFISKFLKKFNTNYKFYFSGEKNWQSTFFSNIYRMLGNHIVNGCCPICGKESIRPNLTIFSKFFSYGFEIIKISREYFFKKESNNIITFIDIL